MENSSPSRKKVHYIVSCWPAGDNGRTLDYLFPASFVGMSFSSTVFHLFAHVCGYISLLLLAAALTAALYLVAELAEEFPSRAGRVLRYAILGILGAHTLLLLCGGGDGLLPVSVGLFTHGAYFLVMNTFPFFDLVSVPSVLSTVGIVVSHVTWFRFFVNMDHHMAAYESYDVLQVFGFFCIMVWLVPVGLMVSLTVNENVLPGIRPVNHAGTGLGGSGSGGKKHTIFMSLVDVASNAINMSGFTARKVSGPPPGGSGNSYNGNGSDGGGDAYYSGGNQGGLRHHGGVGQSKKAY